MPIEHFDSAKASLLAHPLEFNHHQLTVLKIVRSLPGRRLVCQGTWLGKNVFAKMFFGKNGKRYYERDLQGSRLLAMSGISTPELLFAGLDDKSLFHCLILEEVANGVSAQQLWDVADAEHRKELMKILVAEVARHHKAGLIQNDLYLNNFLYHGGKVYTLDGDGIRKMPNILGGRVALNNLALLISKFDVIHEAEWLPELLAIYARERHLHNPPHVNVMQKYVASIRRYVVNKYANQKVLRECTEIKVVHSQCLFQAVSRIYASPLLDCAIENPDQLLEIAQSQRLKSGNTCTVGLAEIDGRKIVVKRYNIKSFWHGLGRALRQSRAAVSWSNAHRLQMHEIATALPVALIEKRFGLIRRQAYFLAEYVEAPDIHDFFANAQVDEAQKKMVANQVAELFYKLNLLCITHGDFKATNVKIAGNQPLLIDLDSMRQHKYRWVFERSHVKDLRRFLHNWQQVPQTKALLKDAFEEFYKDPQLLRRAGWV